MTIKNLFVVAAFIMSSLFGAQAQNKKEVFQVAGNCGMCKGRIENAAKEAGATQASWDADSKKLAVTYDATTTSLSIIQEQVAMVGHDNAGAKASDEAYAKLHGCCKYDRTTAAATAVDSCCKDGKCKDGSCKDTSKDCCKNGQCGEKGKKGKSCCANCAKA
ncbi:MAG: copper chaperone [Bacteroidetes bacterium]|nr:copper chaperone [Bacteroidota bacterium]